MPCQWRGARKPRCDRPEAGVVRTMLAGAAQLLFPPNARCLGCGDLLGAQEDYLCDRCRELLRPLGLMASERCPRCGMPLDHRRKCRTCGDWPADGPSFARCAFAYARPVKGLIRALKYGGVYRLAPCLARHLSDLMIYQPFDPPDVLVPVPMHPLRERRRGFNHALLLARALGKQQGIAVSENDLMRVKNTRQQARLSGARRRSALNGAFRAQGVTGMRVLLVDDVLTTGATACQCARALFAAGARDVQLIALAGAAAKNMEEMRQNPLER